MRLLILWIRASCVLLFTRIAVANPPKKDCDVIEKDVVIIGGGSSGTYSAIRLREDFNKSVIIVEANNRLGGHANTYIDPVTSTPVDFGVVVFYNETLVRDYFTRLGDPLVPTSFSQTPPLYMDFSTNKLLSNYSAPNPGLALQKYAQLLAASFPYLEAGFDLPNPIPQDLLIPFSKFAIKYGLEDLVLSAFQFGEGTGNFLTIPAIYVLKVFSLGVVNNILTGGFLTSSKGSQQLYNNAAAILGDDILFNTTAKSVKRFHDHVEVIITSAADGRSKLIKAKKILVTIPPTVNNMHPFDLTREEKGLFSSFQNVCYGTTLFKVSTNAQYLEKSLLNRGESTPFNLPVLPAIYNIIPTAVSGLFNAKYFDYVTPTVEAVETMVRKKLADLAPVLAAAANTSTIPVFDPVFVRTEQHCPFELSVSSDQIRNGFYRKLLALQGERSMWIAGAAVQTHDSTQIWHQLEATILPGIIRGL